MKNRQKQLREQLIKTLESEQKHFLNGRLGGSSLTTAYQDLLIRTKLLPLKDKYLKIIDHYLHYQSGRTLILNLSSKMIQLMTSKDNNFSKLIGIKSLGRAIANTKINYLYNVKFSVLPSRCYIGIQQNIHRAHAEDIIAQLSKLIKKLKHDRAPRTTVAIKVKTLCFKARKLIDKDKKLSKNINNEMNISMSSEKVKLVNNLFWSPNAQLIKLAKQLIPYAPNLHFYHIIQDALYGQLSMSSDNLDIVWNAFKKIGEYNHVTKNTPMLDFSKSPLDKILRNYHPANDPTLAETFQAHTMYLKWCKAGRPNVEYPDAKKALKHEDHQEMEDDPYIVFSINKNGIKLYSPSVNRFVKVPNNNLNQKLSYLSKSHARKIKNKVAKKYKNAKIIMSKAQ